MASRGVLLDFARQDGEHENLYSRTRRVLVQMSRFSKMYKRFVYPERPCHAIFICHGLGNSGVSIPICGITLEY